MRKPDLTPEEKEVIRKFAQRQHEEEAVESHLADKFSARADLAAKFYKLLAATISFIVAATIWVWTIRMDVTRNTSDLEHLRTDIQQTRDGVASLRLDMKDKADRPKP